MNTLPLFVLLSLVALAFLPLTPRGARRWHDVRFRNAVGWWRFVARRVTYRARQITYAESQALTSALVAGAVPAEAMALVARAAFPHRWWHIGSLSPVAQMRALPDELQLRVLGGLAKVPVAREA